MAALYPRGEIRATGRWLGRRAPRSTGGKDQPLEKRGGAARIETVRKSGAMSCGKRLIA